MHLRIERKLDQAKDMGYNGRAGPVRDPGGSILLSSDVKDCVLKGCLAK